MISGGRMCHADQHAFMAMEETTRALKQALCGHASSLTEDGAITIINQVNSIFNKSLFCLHLINTF